MSGPDLDEATLLLVLALASLARVPTEGAVGGRGLLTISIVRSALKRLLSGMFGIVTLDDGSTAY